MSCGHELLSPGYEFLSLEQESRSPSRESESSDLECESTDLVSSSRGLESLAGELESEHIDHAPEAADHDAEAGGGSDQSDDRPASMTVRGYDEPEMSRQTASEGTTAWSTRPYTAPTKVPNTRCATMKAISAANPRYSRNAAGG